MTPNEARPKPLGLKPRGIVPRSIGAKGTGADRDLMRQSMLARTGEGAPEVEQLSAALALFGRQLRQNLREVAADGGSERGSNWRVDCQSP